MLRIYSKKGFRIWSILLIFCIVLSIFACTVQEANAFAVVIPPVAYYVLGACTVALGIATWQDVEGMRNHIIDTWNGLADRYKTSLTMMKLIGGQGYKLGSDLYNAIKDVVYSRVPEATLKTAIESGLDTEFEEVINTGIVQLNMSALSMQYGYDYYELGNIGTVYTNIPLSTLVGDVYEYIGDYPAYIEYGNTYYQTSYNGFKSIKYIGPNETNTGYASPVLIGSYATTMVYFPITWEFLGNTITITQWDMGRDEYKGTKYFSIQPDVPAYSYQPSIIDNSYTVEPEYIPSSVVDSLVADGVVDAGDVSSNVGTESIDADTVFVYPHDYQELQDLVNLQAQDILDMQQQIDVLTDLSTGEYIGEAELVGDGSGTGIFGDIGRWVLNIPILGAILQLLTNILQSIQSLTAVSDFTIDFSPLKIGLTEVFPFCIPFDLLRMVTVYSATPDDFVFTIDLETDYFVVDHEVDLSPFSIPIIFFRWVVTIWFSWILISRTRDMIKW